MGLIPMLCGVLFPPAMLGVVVALGRFEDRMLREEGAEPRPSRRGLRRRRGLRH